jgi:hypothetical protein
MTPIWACMEKHPLIWRPLAGDALRAREQFVALVKRTADELGPDEGYDELAERVWAALGAAPGVGVERREGPANLAQRTRRE